MPQPPTLPPDITIFERGWLSSNNILLLGGDTCALIDSGYVTHAPQTLALVQAALKGRALDVLVNTHLHSDHCGGNAALQSAYPALMTHIPPGQARFVSHWDPHALTYTPTGQSCPQFRFDALLLPGSELRLGDQLWQVHAAPGHDPHSVILFEPASRTLISADALWERGFGVVFPELEGLDAFDAVGKTIDLIESLAPKLVIPGHGSAFDGVEQSIAVARARLHSFVTQPAKHISYAAKVLLKFKLLEVQAIALDDFIAWACATPYFATIFRQHFPELDVPHGIEQLIGDLVKSGAASRDGVMVRNAG
ncbi:MBL fold metallo-hydrolase [Rhodoferax ferrireducens]|uniref:MBL fold metallo-hydrolase n=1 Tax=Rhodoferax ferrireducens TaxID=192843 RepID=UPI00298E580E|nr:MBL fold metallo-hydrolase [Rhodoferax ferrireducens]WPC66361.1 MBL fold metallo-hydrolase [Rhodoferax ferrireducens]